MSERVSSTPNVFDFKPVIPYQHSVLQLIRRDWDYEDGNLEILLSGSVGSAKSLLMTHIIVSHCMNNEGAQFCIARRTLPDLKSTIFQMILEHLDSDQLKEGKDYWVNQTSAEIAFKNGSKIISRSWADRKSKKGRSLALSGLAVEELTENDDKDREAVMELKMRVGRLGHVTENIFIAATNPDSPAHWGYKYFILGAEQFKTRHVFYSVTSDNPFIPQKYVDQLLQDLDPKMAQRMIYGKWIEIADEVVYYSYDRDKHFVNADYRVVTTHPIHIAYDFNIGEGKPMSCVFYQHIDDVFHFFDEIVIFGARTENTLEEAKARGLLSHPTVYKIHGDASGKHKDTRNNLSDYQIIEAFLKRNAVSYHYEVPASNPPIRERHNTVNAYMLNSNNQVRLKVYKACKTLDEGFRLVKLKPGANFLEDDSKSYQHVTTAAGYGVMWYHLQTKRGKSETTIL